MKNKFTPGPWAQSYSQPCYVYQDSQGVVNFSKPVAECTTEANARLIAAAPDLYEALKRSQYVIESMYQLTKNKSALEYMLRNVAALAKAEGL